MTDLQIDTLFRFSAFQNFSIFASSFILKKVPLSKNHHWAFDRHLISPAFTDTGLAWKVSSALDDRLEGHQKLIELDGRSVLLPKEKKFHPAESSVAWRTERLLA